MSVIRCACGDLVRVEEFDDGQYRKMHLTAGELGSVVELEDGRFHIMRGPHYPKDAIKFMLHTCIGGPAR